jgi:hypothetical protein
VKFLGPKDWLLTEDLVETTGFVKKIEGLA